MQKRKPENHLAEVALVREALRRYAPPPPLLNNGLNVVKILNPGAGDGCWGLEAVNYYRDTYFPEARILFFLDSVDLTARPSNHQYFTGGDKVGWGLNWRWWEWDILTFLDSKKTQERTLYDLILLGNSLVFKTTLPLWEQTVQACWRRLAPSGRMMALLPVEELYVDRDETFWVEMPLDIYALIRLLPVHYGKSNANLNNLALYVWTKDSSGQALANWRIDLTTFFVSPPARLSLPSGR